MKYDLVIFDLDGTLLDTLQDLTDAVNCALSEASMQTRSLDFTRRAIGNGVLRLIRAAAPEGTDEDALASLLAAFKARYLAHVNDATLPYPGIPELLDALRTAGIHTAINSNKVDSATRLLWKAHFPDAIELALGEQAGTPKKPAPDGALHIMAAFGATPERTLYVGDGEADILTAQNAGVDCAWVSLSKLWKMVKDRGAWCAVVHGAKKSRTRLSD